MLAKLLCTKRKSASAPRCLRCVGATIDIVNSITRTANRSGQGGIFASMFTKGQHRGHGDHWAWRLTGNYCKGSTAREMNARHWHRLTSATFAILLLVASGGWGLEEHPGRSHGCPSDCLVAASGTG